VNALRGHVKPLAGLERLGLAFRGDGHLALEDDVGGDIRVGVVGVENVCAVLPDVHTAEAFRV